MRSDSNGSVRDGSESGTVSAVLLGDSGASASLAELGVPLLLAENISGVDSGLELDVSSLSQLNVSDGSDSGVSGSVSDDQSSLLGGHLESVLSLSGEVGDLLLADLELSSDAVESLLVEVGLDLNSPQLDTVSVGLSPVLESESGDGGSSDDVLASAGGGLLDSDHLLSLGAPLHLLLDLDDLSLVRLDFVVNLSLVDFHVGLNLNSLSDVLPLEALVGLVDGSSLEALSVGTSLEAVVLAVVGLVSSAYDSVSGLVSGLNSSGGGWGLGLWVLVALLLLDNLNFLANNLDWLDWDSHDNLLVADDGNSGLVHNNDWGNSWDNLLSSNDDSGLLSVDDWSWGVDDDDLLVLGNSDSVDWSGDDSGSGLHNNLLSDSDIDDWLSDDFLASADDDGLGRVDLDVGDNSVSWLWSNLGIFVDDDNRGDNLVDGHWVSSLVDDNLDLVLGLDDDWNVLSDDDSWLGHDLNVFLDQELVHVNNDLSSGLDNLGDWGADNLLVVFNNNLVSDNNVLNLGCDDLVVSLNNNLFVLLDVDVVNNLLSGGDSDDLRNLGDDDWLFDNLDGLLDVGGDDGLVGLLPGPSLLVALAGGVGLSADGEALLGRASSSPDSASLGPTSVALDPGLRDIGVGAPVGGLDDLIDVFGTNLWLSLNNLLGSGVVSDNLGSGELEGKLLSLVGHS